MPTRKWKRLGSCLLPKELHYNDQMTDWGLYLFIMFDFLPSSRSFPLFIYGSIWEQREKKRRKSEVSPVDTTHFANQTSQYSPTIQFRRKLTERNHSILMGVPIIFTKIGDYRPIWELKCSNRGCRNLGNFFSMRHSWWASYFAREKTFFSRARDTRARSLGFAFFCFHNLHTRVLKRGFFSTEKRKKWLSRHPVCLQTAATFKNVGRSS